jgi:hypothetical protein
MSNRIEFFQYFDVFSSSVVRNIEKILGVFILACALSEHISIFDVT